MTTLLRRLTRKAMRLGTHCPGCLPVARRTRARALAVVMYHGVTAEPLPVENWCQLDVEEFARQIEFLAASYTLMPLREVVDRLERGAPLPKFPAVLTFDDGFRNVLTTAYPVLEKYWAPIWSPSVEEIAAGPITLASYGFPQVTHFTFLCQVAVIQDGSLFACKEKSLEHVRWFYHYCLCQWFIDLKSRMLAINKSLDPQKVISPLDVRDWKWYCGNGGGD